MENLLLNLAVRLLGEKVTDYMVGEALSLFSENASMYISSWGPNDDGRTMRSPGKFMNSAFKRTGTMVSHLTNAKYHALKRMTHLKNAQMLYDVVK